MNTYIPDTNVLIDFGRKPDVRTKLENAVRGGSKFVIAPSTMTELARGVVNGGSAHFDQNKEVLAWLQAQSAAILDLPRPFMGKILGVHSKKSRVEPDHYLRLVNMMVNAKTFNDLLKQKDAPGSVWTDIDKADSIHRAQVDKEFDWLEKVAKLPTTPDLAAKFCETFGETAHPDPVRFREHFSTGLEYIEASIAKIRGGAKPRKNDRGRYGDSQLFFYLAAPEISLLTQENFAGDIKLSPQRTRIVGLDSLS